MPVGSYCRRSVCTASPEESVRGAAQRMEKEGVGLLVVTEDGGPVGVLTDRDLALRVVADRRDPASTRVADAMTSKPATILVDATLAQATELMSGEGVRRLPVVDSEGRALGVIAADDVVRLLAEEVGGLAGVVNAQLPVGVQVGAAVSQEERALRPVEHYHKEVATIRADADAATLAELMRDRGVGCVVVVGEADEPVGVATDRDLALRLVAAERDPGTTSASTIMSSPAITVEASQPIEEVVEVMKSRGVRRVPVLSDGHLAGVVTFDDLLVAFGRELQRLGSATARDVRNEERRTRLERLGREAEERIRELGAWLQRAGDGRLEAIGREFEALREKVRRTRD